MCPCAGSCIKLVIKLINVKATFHKIALLMHWYEWLCCQKHQQFFPLIK